MRKLAPLVDYHVELMNDPSTPDIEIVTPGETWQRFTSNWVQYVWRILSPSLATVRRIDLTILFCVCFYPKGHVDGFPGINTVYMRNPKESKK